MSDRSHGVVPWCAGPRVGDQMASACRYRKVLGKARKFELDRHGVILCTCSCAASASLKNLNVRQILVDEAGMATEPETLIPLVAFSDVEKVSGDRGDRAAGVQAAHGGAASWGDSGSHAAGHTWGVRPAPVCSPRWFFSGTTSSCGLWSRMSSCRAWGWIGPCSRGTTRRPTCWTRSTAW